jgi:hypothetical protein
MGLDHAIYTVEQCPGACEHYVDITPIDKREPHIELLDPIITWRKENHLHAWFVEHVNGGEDDGLWSAEVSLEQLAGLAVTIERALESPQYAGEHLAPQAGFFFGSTEMDDYYRADLSRELGEIRQLLADEQLSVESGNPPRRFAYWCWW